MQCPKCGIEAKISKSFTEVAGDNSPDEQTTVSTVLIFECRNPQCENYNKQIDQVKHKTYP